MPGSAGARLGSFLESVYDRYHRPDFISPDPLQFLLRYPEVRDRELVAALAAGLAYGQVKSIVSSVERVLAPLGPHPARLLARSGEQAWSSRLVGFRHRWTSAEEMTSFLRALSEAQRKWGLLGSRLAELVEPGEGDVQAALQRWVGELRAFGLPARHSLLSDPARGSACKRLHLMARWMVRCDAVDPGGWSTLSPALLLVPVDVHMHRFGRAFGFTRRRTADLETAREITAGFRRYVPHDPVRYDFALTRMPIHDGMKVHEIRQLVKNGRG